MGSSRQHPGAVVVAPLIVLCLVRGWHAKETGKEQHELLAFLSFVVVGIEEYSCVVVSPSW